MSFGQEEMLQLEENRSLHLPLTGGEEGDLPALTLLYGLKLAPLGRAGISRVTGAREDGGDLSYYSSKIVKFNCSSSRSSSLEQSSTINPSRGGELLSTGDPSTSLSVLVPVPLDEMTAGGGGRSVTGIWEIAPERVPRADFSPKTREPPWFV
jgi:hypothetical protein